jgi:hypothetical protein
MFTALENHFDQATHVFVPWDPPDAVELVDGLHLMHPSAQVVIGRIHPKNTQA